jgi:hypothetical protein
MAMLSHCQQWSLPMPLSVAERMANKRARDKAKGIVSPSDRWAKENPDKHRLRVASWRAKNTEKAGQIYRDNQATRRSTPWGQINNCMWPSVHRGVRAKKPRMGKYNMALGYSWADLRVHIEWQFLVGMTWENWGEVWELDHIKPASLFKYMSLDDPLFRECWALSNLRPLWRDANAKKSAIHVSGETLAAQT